jgi:hypothetical protein
MSNDHSVDPAPGPAWFKSSYSDSGGGNCVEVALGQDTVHVRDSKDKAAGATLTVTLDAWAAFVGQVTNEL